MKFIFKILVFGILLLGLDICVGESDPWQIVRTETFQEMTKVGEVSRAAVIFANGKRFVLPLQRAKSIAKLVSTDGTPYLLGSGADCTECDENITLRFFTITENGLKGTGNRHTFPGTETDYMDSDRILLKARTYFGRCLNENGDVVVWIQDYLGEDGKWHNLNSVMRITKNGENLKILLPEEGTPSTIEAKKAQGLCFELPGIKRHSEP